MRNSFACKILGGLLVLICANYCIAQSVAIVDHLAMAKAVTLFAKKEASNCPVRARTDGQVNETEKIVTPCHLTNEESLEFINEFNAFNPNQICIEGLSGETIEEYLKDVKRYGEFIQKYAGPHITFGKPMQTKLNISPKSARDYAFLMNGTELNLTQKISKIQLLIAGYEFPNAVLAWSYLTVDERTVATEILGRELVSVLHSALGWKDKIYSLVIPLAHAQKIEYFCSIDIAHEGVDTKRLAAQIPKVFNKNTQLALGLTAASFDFGSDDIQPPQQQVQNSSRVLFIVGDAYRQIIERVMTHILSS